MSSTRWSLLGLYASQVVQLVVGLLTLPFIVNTLGLQSYGKVAYGLAAVGVVTPLLDFGLGSHLMRHAALEGAESVVLRQLFWRSVQLRMLMALALVVLLLAAAEVDQRVANNLVIGLCAITACAGQLFSLDSLVRGLELFRVDSVVQIAVRIMYLFGLLLLLPEHASAETVMLLMATAAVAHTAVVATIIIRRIGGPAEGLISPAALLQTIRSSTTSAVLKLVCAVFASAPVLILGHVLGSQAAGVYGVAERAMRIVQQMLLPLTTVSFASVARAARDGMGQAVFKVGVLQAALGATGTVVLVVAANSVMPWAFKSFDTQSQQTLVLLAASLWGICLNSLFGHSLLLSLGRLHALLLATGAGFASFLLLVVLTKPGGPQAVAAAYAIGEIVAGVLAVTFARRLLWRS